MINNLTIADLVVTIYPIQRRIQDFPEGVANLLFHQKLFRELNEYEENWTVREKARVQNLSL